MWKAWKKFEGQKRRTWEDYHSHPYEVTKIFIEFQSHRISENWLIACILHDNIEDINDETYEEIEKDFWKEIAFLVELLSKPNVEEFWGNKEKRNKNYFWKFSNLTTLKIYVREKWKDKWWKNNKDEKWQSKRTNLNKWNISNATIGRYACIIWVIKICDRIHNLQTMPPDTYKVEKIKKNSMKLKNTLRILHKNYITQIPEFSIYYENLLLLQIWLLWKLKWKKHLTINFFLPVKIPSKSRYI
jgi:(p)ppGpp synthase/HD superfamily hydrolase